MADISKFSPDGINEYNLKDAYAREVITDHKSIIGRIIKRNDIFTDTLGNILSEWDIVMTPTNSNDFNSTLEYTYENSGNINNLTKQANTVPMVTLKNANGYTDKLLVDGLTENSKVFLLGNTPLSSDGNVERPYSIYYNLKKKSGKTIAAGDFKVKFEMDIAILNPNATTPRKGAGYDVFELDIQDPSVVGYPYVGILDGRSNGYMRCAGTETRSGYSNGFMYKYLGNFPIGEWATLRIEVNGLDHVSMYVNDILYDDDLNNPLDKSTTPDGENGNIGLSFGDFDYVICKEIRCMNCNKEKFEGGGGITANTYTVTKNATNCTITGGDTVTHGSTYNATLTADSGYAIDSVTVTMGGTDITSTAYSNGTISIANVTGDIVITATASIINYTVTKTGTNCTITGNNTATHGSSYTATITADNGYTLNTVTVTMGGTDITSTAYSNGTVTISNVTGNVVITVTTTANTYTVTKNATNCTITGNNTATHGSSYTATITADNGYTLNTVTVTMGGTDITSTAYSNGTVTISNVTGNVVITASAIKSGITVPNGYSYSMTTPTTFDSNTRQIDTKQKLDSYGAGAYSIIIEWDNPTPITDDIQILTTCGGYSNTLRGWYVDNNNAGNAKFKVHSNAAKTDLTNVEQSNKQVLILTRASEARELYAYANSATAIECPMGYDGSHDFNWILGCDANGKPRFTGTIYSAYRYNRVLTAEEIASIFS